MSDALQPIEPIADVDDGIDKSGDGARQRALALAQAGLPLNAKEFALIRRLDVSTFHKKAKLGAFDEFLLRPALGTKRYSGVLVARWLRGEVLEESAPARVFGRKRRG